MTCKIFDNIDLFMKYRILYIMLFLFAFLFPSVAQNSYIEYEYVDGTKEREAIDMIRMSFKYCYNEGLTYRITDICIDNVFDTIRPMDLVRNESRKLIDDVLHIKFREGEPVSVSGPFNMTSMGGFRMDSYGFRSDKKDADNGIMAISFYSYSLPDFAYHNGKQISSVSGSIGYSKFRNIPSSILSEELKENLKPFYLAPILLKGTSDVLDSSYIKFISSSLPNEMAVNRVMVIGNLKRMGYTLASQKGVFPLTYQNDKGSSILMYETYIMIKVSK